VICNLDGIEKIRVRQLSADAIEARNAAADVTRDHAR
jgi:hypothetical protein